MHVRNPPAKQRPTPPNKQPRAAPVRQSSQAAQRHPLERGLPAPGRQELRDQETPEQRARLGRRERSEEHTSELQSLMRNSYAVFCLKTKKKTHRQKTY